MLFACRTGLLADPNGGRPISSEPRDLTSGSKAVIGTDGYKAFICRTRASISVFLFQCCVCIENTWTADVARRLSEVSGGLAGFAFVTGGGGRTVRECGEAHGQSLGLWRAAPGDTARPQTGKRSPPGAVRASYSGRSSPGRFQANSFPSPQWGGETSRRFKALRAIGLGVVSLIPFISGHSVSHVFSFS